MDFLNKRVIVTAGATYEPIDPVRFIGNRSSGKQGIEIAKVFAERGADVVLIAGVIQPQLLEDLPANITVRNATTADEMLDATLDALPCDIAVFVAAVSDWKVANFSEQKIKKNGDTPPTLTLTENPDILQTVCRDARRPHFVVGFAAETENIVANAQAKLAKKGCDCIVANSVAGGKTFMDDDNQIYIISADGVRKFPTMSKGKVAEILADYVK